MAAADGMTRRFAGEAVAAADCASGVAVWANEVLANPTARAAGAINFRSLIYLSTPKQSWGASDMKRVLTCMARKVLLNL